jgi:hypothetical protein
MGRNDPMVRNQAAPVLVDTDLTGHAYCAASVRSQRGYLLLVTGRPGVRQQAALKTADRDVGRG